MTIKALYFMPKKTGIAMIMAVFLVLLCLLSPVIFAHKVILDAYVMDTSIEGELGFSNGIMAALEPVYVKDKDGNIIDTITTDADGLFMYTPRFLVDHHFYVNLGAGHIGNVLISTHDLADLSGENHWLDLSERQSKPLNKALISGENPPSDMAGLVAQTAALEVNKDNNNKAVSTTAQKSQATIAAEITRMNGEIRQLRRAINSYKEKNTLQQILGGLGYIFGLVGVGYYMAARQTMRNEIMARKINASHLLSEKSDKPKQSGDPHD